MKVMRLFRRSLLCLVVGVTAFGAAGWAFRPKPNWEVALEGFHDLPRLAKSATPPKTDDPVWVYSVGARGMKIQPYLNGVVRCVSHAGNVVRSETMRIDRAVVGVDGALVVESSSGDLGNKLPENRFAVVDVSEAPVIERSYPIHWKLSGDRLHVHETRRSPRGFVCRIVELRTGETRSTIRLDQVHSYIEPNSMAFSPDCRLLAVCERARSDRTPPLGIEVFDVETKAMVKRIVPKPTPTDDGAYATLPRFVNGGRDIQFMWFNAPGTAKPAVSYRCSVDPQRADDARIDSADDNPMGGASPTRPVAETPAEFAETVHVKLFEESNDGNRLWRAVHYKPDWIAFCIDDGRESTVGWRKYPFSAVVKEPPLAMSINPGPRMYWPSDPSLSFVPGKPEVVVVADETGFGANLPATVRRALPTNWSLLRSGSVARWHDWERNEWRNVGLTHGASDFQLRPSAMIVLTSTSERNLLQSWPLPPRDPKWPALGVAALSMAGTWWACAKRYRRRMMRAANAA